MLSQSNCETFTDECINVHVVYYSMVLIYLSRSFQYAFASSAENSFLFPVRLTDPTADSS